MQVILEDDLWPSLPPVGNPMGKPNTHRPSPWAKLPASGVAAHASPALTAVMTKAKAAPKIGSRKNSNSKASHASPKMRAKWSPAHTSSSVMTTAAAAADLDPLPEPQQPAQEAVPAHQDAKEESDAGEVTSQKSDEKKEDKHEKKEDNHEKKEDKHEKKEDKHEEKTESNYEETQDSTASTSESPDQEPIQPQESSSEHGESRGDFDESASSAAVEPTPVPEIAQGKEAPQALCLCVGMYQWPTKDNQTPMAHAQCLASEGITTTQLLPVSCSFSRTIVMWQIEWDTLYISVRRFSHCRTHCFFDFHKPAVASTCVFWNCKPATTKGNQWIVFAWQAETKDTSMWPSLGIASAPKAQHMAGWAWARAPASVVAAKSNPELTPWQKEQQRKQKIAQEEAAKKRQQQERSEQQKKEAAERNQKKKEQEEKVKREKAEAARIQKEKEEFELQEKARKEEEAKELERQELERQELERKELERQELEKRDSEGEARQAAVEAQQPAEQAPQQEAQASTWQARIFFWWVSHFSYTRSHKLFRWYAVTRIE